MAKSLQGMKVCENCGELYLNYCLNCERLQQPERVHELLTRFKLDEESLIRKLSQMVDDGSFPALNLAVTLRDMKPAQRSEVNVEAGKTMIEAKDRMHDLFSRLSARRLKKVGE
jgi:hypothetical protein